MIEIKTARIKDLDDIFNIEEKNFGYEKYSVGALTDFINNISKNDVVRVLFKDEKLIGYIIYRINNEESELLKICIEMFYRNKGYAGILMDDYISYCRYNNVKNVFLEVRSDNLIAIKFYKLYGFKEISVRKDYYKNPISDAVIFKLSL